MNKQTLQSLIDHLVFLKLEIPVEDIPKINEAIAVINNQISLLK